MKRDLTDLLARAIFVGTYPESEAAWDAPGDGGREHWRIKARQIQPTVEALIAEAEEAGYQRALRHTRLLATGRPS